MRKSNILPSFALLLMVIVIGGFWLSSSFEPLVFDRENVVFQVPKNVIKWLLFGAFLLTFTTFYLLWKNRCFDCQDKIFIEKSDFLISLFITIFLNFMPFFLLLLASFIFINGFFDRSPSYQIQNMIIDKNQHHSSKGDTTYWLTLKNTQNLIYLPVKGEEYERTNCDDNVIITAKKGWFNVAWRENYKIISQS